MAVKTTESIGAAVSLAIHIAIAVALFAVISGATILLNLVTTYCEARHLMPSAVLYGMHALEFFLWAADVLCFVLFVAVEVWKFCVTVWEGRGA